jgi:hypothetical protein
MGPAADEDGNVLLLLVVEFDEGGTCWNARVTSWSDILDGTFAAEVGGGVSPSSDLTSCSVNGRAVRSSAMPSREFTACTKALSEGCDHTAFRCSGSGALAGDSFAEEKLKGDFVHGVLYDADPGVMRFLSTYTPLSHERRCIKIERSTDRFIRTLRVQLRRNNKSRGACVFSKTIHNATDCNRLHGMRTFVR